MAPECGPDLHENRKRRDFVGGRLCGEKGVGAEKGEKGDGILGPIGASSRGTIAAI